jgi:hypothetical protein
MRAMKIKREKKFNTEKKKYECKKKKERKTFTFRLKIVIIFSAIRFAI